MVDSEPFGQRAVRLGLATSEQVRQALETQKILAEKAGLLGEILVEMGWLDPVHYIEVVQELAENDEEEDREQVQERFAQMALERDYIESEQLEQARQIQSTRTQKNKLIGQIMVEMGILAGGERDRVLKSYSSNGKTNR